MNELQILNIDGIECYEKDGTAYLKLETVARGLGFTETAKSGNECVRWRTVRKYLEDLGIATCCDEKDLPDFIPENVFYRLAMKAKNETAEKFQAKVADEIIPSIRKTGGYIAGQETLSDDELLEKAVLVAQRKIAERDKVIEQQRQKIEQDKQLIKHIRNRTKAENKVISLKNLLNVYDMEMYFMSCGNRIADAGFIDGECVKLNFLNLPDLLFDSIGIMRCFDILSGYIDEDELIKIYRIAKNNDKMTQCINSQLDILRASDIKRLFNMSFRISKFAKKTEQEGMSEKFTKEQLVEILKMSRLELLSRTPINKVRIFIIKKATKVYVSIRYHNIISLMKRCSRSVVQEN